MSRFILVFLGLIMTFSAQAQELRIGYIDPDFILSKMPETAAVEQRLKNFAERKQKELIDEQTKFRQRLEMYQQKQAVISEAAKKKEESELQAMSGKLQEMERNSQIEMQQKQSELMAPLLDQIQKAIDAVSKELKLSYVFNAVTSQGDYIILYASDEMKQKYDITQKVMDKLKI
jgi:outer membrane protein